VTEQYGLPGAVPAPTPAIPTPPPTAAPIAPPLSEQPDKTVFAQYFHRLSLGKLPPEWIAKEGWHLHVIETNIFSQGDTLVTVGEVIREVQLSLRYYDIQAGSFVGSPVMPPPCKPGGFASASRLDLSPGRYELRCYVDKILVAVFPFEVITGEQPSGQSTVPSFPWAILILFVIGVGAIAGIITGIKKAVRSGRRGV